MCKNFDIFPEDNGDNKHNYLHIKLSQLRGIIAGLRPAFNIFSDKLNEILGQACRIAFGPDREEDSQGARAWQIKADMIAASIVIIAFLVYLINFLIWLF